MTDDLLTLTDVADRVHKSTRWVRDRIRTGDLQASKLGRDYLVTERDLEAWLTRLRRPYHPVIGSASPRTVARIQRDVAARKRVAS